MLPLAAQFNIDPHTSIIVLQTSRWNAVHPDDIYNVNVASQQLNTHSDIFATSAMVLFANAYFSDEIGISSAFCNNDVDLVLIAAYRMVCQSSVVWTSRL